MREIASRRAFKKWLQTQPANARLWAVLRQLPVGRVLRGRGWQLHLQNTAAVARPSAVGCDFHSALETRASQNNGNSFKNSMNKRLERAAKAVLDPKEIAPDESAVIFAADGRPRLFFPDGADDEPVNEGALWMTRVAMLIATPALVKVVDELIEEKQNAESS